MPLIYAEAISKRYQVGDVAVDALADVTVAVEAGEAVAIMGSSGSGKSTLMHLLGCLDVPTSGQYRLAGEDVRNLSLGSLAVFRNCHIGFIFQNFNLLPRATAIENVELPLVYAGWDAAKRRRRALQLLEVVGLVERAHHLPSQLSGGQQQRVAIARALSNNPSLLLADEPTGSLDSASSRGILDLLREINSHGPTVILVTHDAAIARAMRRVITLQDGRIISDKVGAEPYRPETSALAAASGE